MLWSVAGHSADLSSGEALQESCADTFEGESRANAQKYRACTSYLANLVEAAVSHSMGIRGSCVPFGVTAEQLRQVWLAYAIENRHQLDRDSAKLALAAIDDAWSCKE